MGLLALTCIGCATAQSPQSDHFSIEEQASCKSAGGEYVEKGSLGFYTCEIIYPDGGKECRDMTECEGKCLSEKPVSFNADFNRNRTGKCQSTNEDYGCLSELHNGVLTPGICLD